MQCHTHTQLFSAAGTQESSITAAGKRKKQMCKRVTASKNSQAPDALDAMLDGQQEMLGELSQVGCHV